MMFRTNSFIVFPSKFCRRQKKKKDAMKWQAYDEMRARKKGIVYSPKSFGEGPMPAWFNASRLRTMLRAYEKCRNTNHLTVKFSPEDIKEFSDFKINFQYFEYIKFREAHDKKYPDIKEVKRIEDEIQSLPTKYKIEFTDSNSHEDTTLIKNKNFSYYLPQLIRILPKDKIYRMILAEYFVSVVENRAM